MTLDSVILDVVMLDVVMLDVVMPRVALHNKQADAGLFCLSVTYWITIICQIGPRSFKKVTQN
jgi:hypothetical protein